MGLLVICLNMSFFLRFLRDQNGNIVELTVFLKHNGFPVDQIPVNCGKDGYRSHEQMSAEMVDHIVDEHHIEVDVETVKRVQVS